ncbi:hypothetical protein P0W64_04215 [Tsukamurella sp. 8F]|uniref:DUF6640 family protein n=1 Tax=unclassified Tsukamurella TaxID=2633480 RepID=UPI0023B975F6|nr:MULTISPECIES: DUF6640 family protein [unclassified Tsukamurella]MDF0529692.1 hypothetical protein [Tsukamurella sp. 8J]MDF0585977.1 hypothetical protein [Tsukamurella sp. 8F]
MITAKTRASRVSRALTAAAAFATMVGAPLADLVIPATAAQHLRNDAWPPHAKFHDAQYIVMSVLLGATALTLTARRGGSTRTQMRTACALVATPWVGLLAAPLFPGTAVQDPGFDNPTVAGLHPQVLLALILLVLLSGALVADRRPLDHV